MTVVTVVRKGTSACMAADTVTNFGGQHLTDEYSIHADKILTMGGIHLGVVGSPAHRLVLQSALKEALNNAVL